MFITFEGVEGSGKSTQIKLLEKTFKDRGFDVMLTREPGGPDISEQIRKILVDAKNSKMVPACEVLLYYAARAQHLEEWIKPWTKQGKIILCDRFVDASLAYQGFARGLSLEDLNWLGQFVLKDFKIDLTVLFDLPVEAGLARAKSRAQKLSADQREDRFEQEKIEFHERVRQGYLTLAQNNSQRFLVVDATLDKESLHQQISQYVFDKFQNA